MGEGCGYPAALLRTHAEPADDGPEAVAPDGIGSHFEVDEVYKGRRRRNMPNAERRQFKDTVLGAIGKTAVNGTRDRATDVIHSEVIDSTNARTLQGFVEERIATTTMIHMDDAVACQGIGLPHEAAGHSFTQYMRGQIHTNGIESLRATLKRGCHGICLQISPKWARRQVSEFAVRRTIREENTMNQMEAVVAGLVGKQLTNRDLVG